MHGIPHHNRVHGYTLYLVLQHWTMTIRDANGKVCLKAEEQNDPN